MYIRLIRVNFHFVASEHPLFWNLKRSDVSTAKSHDAQMRGAGRTPNGHGKVLWLQKAPRPPQNPSESTFSSQLMGMGKLKRQRPVPNLHRSLHDRGRDDNKILKGAFNLPIRSIRFYKSTACNCLQALGLPCLSGP